MSSSSPSILAFSAHAADVFQRAGGTVANYVNASSKVTVVCLTYGEKGESPLLWKNKGMTVQKAKMIKKKEATKAAAIIGIDIRFLDWDDNPLIMNKEREYVLMDIIRELKPDIMLTHWMKEPVNCDHEVTSRSTLRAFWYASRAGIKSEYPPHSVQQIYLFTPSRGVDDSVEFRPNIYIDVTQSSKIKDQALRCFRSQAWARRKPEELSAYFTDLMEPWRGWQSGVQRAESFVAFLHRASKFFNYTK